MRTAKQRGHTMVRSHSDRLVRSEPFEVFIRPQRSLPARLVGLVIRWRAELVVLGLVLTAWVWLTKQMPAWAAGTTLGGTVVVLVIWPASRRYLVHRGYAVMVRHRLRSTFVERRVMNYSGNLPLLIWARPTPVGEQVWVLLRAGIDPRISRSPLPTTPCPAGVVTLVWSPTSAWPRSSWSTSSAATRSPGPRSSRR